MAGGLHVRHPAIGSVAQPQDDRDEDADLDPVVEVAAGAEREAPRPNKR
ncbi:hypothetical protein ODJ79_40790 [Actinoplanes sp. KI2]|nr:hypothetical protein [Actinoplanes sp. KI2]MCU7730091.1 hypothetical protein [Actinoplanes sp. KI2]